MTSTPPKNFSKPPLKPGLLWLVRLIGLFGLIAVIGLILYQCGVFPGQAPPDKTSATQQNQPASKQAKPNGQDLSPPPQKAEPTSTEEKLAQLEAELLKAAPGTAEERAQALLDQQKADELKKEAALANLPKENVKERPAEDAAPPDKGSADELSQDTKPAPQADKSSGSPAAQAQRPEDSKLPKTIDLPPYVPEELFKKQNKERTLAKGYINPARGLSRAQQPRFKDLDNLDLTVPWNQRLLAAVRFAQNNLNLLLARQAVSRLEWQRPITRRELAIWLAQFSQLPLQDPLGTTSPFGDIEARYYSYPFIKAVVDANWMHPLAVPPPQPSADEPNPPAQKPVFQPDSLYRRQELCKTYLTITGQEAYLLQALRDGREDWRDWLPPNADPFDTPLSIKDWQNVAPGYKGAVAFCYRDGILEDVFDLPPSKLITSEGLHPNRSVSRGEVLIFLHNLWRRRYFPVAQQPTMRSAQ